MGVVIRLQNLFWLDIGYIHLYPGLFGSHCRCCSRTPMFVVQLEPVMEASVASGGWTASDTVSAQEASSIGKPGNASVIVIANLGLRSTRRAAAIMGPLVAFVIMDAVVACLLQLAGGPAATEGMLQIAMLAVFVGFAGNGHVPNFKWAPCSSPNIGS